MKDNFYQTSADWAYELYQSQTLWLRRALFGLVALTILLTLSLLANLSLLPLKEKVPYLYAFDHASGEITKVGSLEPTSLSTNWELSRYLLMQYVINYESYHYNNIDLPYQMIWAQSADDIKYRYEGLVKSTNSASPYQQYGKDKYVSVRIISINRLNENTVDVKFEKTLHDQTASLEKGTQKEAIIKWSFSTAETTEKMLERDPLGFKVTYYQVSQVNLEK